jgi:hypothetical protein
MCQTLKSRDAKGVPCQCWATAGILGKRRGGIVWKGTFYPEKMLREKKKVRM